MTRVTGLIATYNQQEYIAEAVRSLVDQCDEVVVVDDASSDETAAVLASLPSDRLRVLRNEQRGGVSRAFNRGAEAATGEILLIQGGDDRSVPDRAQRQREALEDPGVALSYSLPRVIDSIGRGLPAALAGEFLAGADDPEPLEQLFLESNYICAPSVALRRPDYLGLGGFRRGLDLLQDLDLWLSLAARGAFARAEAPVVDYRKHSSNLSREYTSLDSPKARRLAVENDNIRRRFLGSAGDAVLLRLAAACRLDLKRFAALDRAERVVLLQLSHPHRGVVRRGIDTLLDLVAADDGDAVLARLGLDDDDIGRFCSVADPDDLGDIARALGSADAMSRRPGE